jgi:hypothetical protein
MSSGKFGLREPALELVLPDGLEALDLGRDPDVDERLVEDGPGQRDGVIDAPGIDGDRPSHLALAARGHAVRARQPFGEPFDGVLVDARGGPGRALCRLGFNLLARRT